MPYQPPLFVTQPALPPLADFAASLEEIWASKILTNGGVFHQQLEAALCEYLGVRHLTLFANGTMALVTALKALGLSGEVITTPFSFVATSHVLPWSGITPVFADIDERTLNLDPGRVEDAITPRTTGILAVHCYGNPCNVDALDEIAHRRGLKLVYDAAHAFGVHCHCGTLLAHGDLSVLSFHATKVFSTIEGGATVCHDEAMKRRLDLLKNFGFAGETSVVETGLNGKMNELQAAFGLCQLKRVDGYIQRRAEIYGRYREILSGARGITCVPISAKAANHGYFPILVGHEYPLGRDELYERLRAEGIRTRRYFFPLISDFPMYRHLPSAKPANLPVAQKAASQVLCLPIYPDLSPADQERVVSVILDP